MARAINSGRYLADREEHVGKPDEACVANRQFAHCLHTLQSSFAAPWPVHAPLEAASRCRYLVVATSRLIFAEANIDWFVHTNQCTVQSKHRQQLYCYPYTTVPLAVGTGKNIPAIETLLTAPPSPRDTLSAVALLTWST
jgi:hypothetical protein